MQILAHSIISFYYIHNPCFTWLNVVAGKDRQSGWFFFSPFCWSSWNFYWNPRMHKVERFALWPLEKGGLPITSRMTGSKMITELLALFYLPSPNPTKESYFSHLNPIHFTWPCVRAFFKWFHIITINFKVFYWSFILIVTSRVNKREVEEQRHRVHKITVQCQIVCKLTSILILMQCHSIDVNCELSINLKQWSSLPAGGSIDLKRGTIYHGKMKTE